MSSRVYNRAFYEFEEDTSLKSSVHIIPLLVEAVHPRSVVDVGCGIGAFLKEFESVGVHDVLGIEGEWFDKSSFRLPRERLLIKDITRPFSIGRKFDLVLSLEVGEHFDSKYAPIYVSNLTKLGDVVLFSAAIPFQGGTHHVNEQWPEYWARLFISNGFVPIDALRLRLWNNPDVSSYYAQNSVFYVKDGSVGDFPTLSNMLPLHDGYPLRLVHPKQWDGKTKYLNLLPPFARDIVWKVSNLVLRSGLNRQ